MPVPVDAELYAAVKLEADKKFAAPTSAYKSAWMVRRYKELGGKYADKQPNKTKGLRRWFAEKWVDVNRPGKQCGRKEGKGPYPVCRPSVRVTKKTPLTVNELLPEEIKAAQNAKLSGRIKAFRPKKRPDNKTKQNKTKQVI
jgi:hypothetical protein